MTYNYDNYDDNGAADHYDIIAMMIGLHFFTKDKNSPTEFSCNDDDALINLSQIITFSIPH